MDNVTERKQNLIIALLEEKERLNNKGIDTTEHDIVIEYLTTGETSHNPNDYDMLDSCMNDYECLLNDYEC